MRGRPAVALVLAIGVSVWLILVGINIIFQEYPVSDQLSTLLSTALGATVGALAVYLGEGKPEDREDYPLSKTELEKGEEDPDA